MFAKLAMQHEVYRLIEPHASFELGVVMHYVCLEYPLVVCSSVGPLFD